MTIETVLREYDAAKRECEASSGPEHDAAKKRLAEACDRVAELRSETPDGTTALIGDNLASGGGAAWLWLLAGAIYKLTATDAMGAAFFGSTVALAPDGNTALIGGYNDNGGRGAAWLFINPLAITRLTPPSGPASGGTTVMISGTGFSGATHVRFGPTPATSFTVDGATQITAISPPGQPGVVDVTVTTSVGTSEAIPASKFTYV